jgi:cytochrome c peroxidase
VAWDGARFLDRGRAGVTGRDTDLGAFRTPGLRQVVETAPYMHDGSLRTLEDVVEFYDSGGRPNPYLDSEVLRLGLSREEKTALVAFLKALSGTVVEGGH